MLTGCARPAAQPAEPPPPQVTVAEVIARDITEWDEFTGRLEAVNTVDVRPRVSGYVAAVRFEEGAIVRRGDLLFQIDPRPFQAEVDRLSRRADRAPAPRCSAPPPSCSAPSGWPPRTRCRTRSTSAAPRSPRSRRRRSPRSKRRCAPPSSNLEFTRVTAPIAGRVGRAIVTEGNLVSSGPGEATLLTTVVSLDPIYASFDADEQTFLRYGDLARAGKRASARQAGLPIRMALASDDATSRAKGEMNFLDNQIDPATGTIRGRAVFRNTDRQPDAGPVRAPAAARQRRAIAAC